MKNLPVIAIAAALVLLVVARMIHVAEAPAAAPSIIPAMQPGDPDLTAAFAESADPEQARADARQFALMCFILAEGLARDGDRTSPRIKTGVQLDDLRRWDRDWVLKGHTFGELYPSLPVAVGAYFDAKVGNSGGPIEDRRADYVAAFRAISRSAGAAAQ